MKLYNRDLLFLGVVDCWESDIYFSQSLCILTELLDNYRLIVYYFGLFYQTFVYFNIHKVFPGQNSKNNLIGVHFSDFTWIFPWNERNQLENAFRNQLASRSWQKSRRVSVPLDFKSSLFVKICKCAAKPVDNFGYLLTHTLCWDTLWTIRKKTILLFYPQALHLLYLYIFVDKTWANLFKANTFILKILERKIQVQLVHI